jgi:hypothetical protein
MILLLRCLTQLDPERRGLTAAEMVDLCRQPPDPAPACLPDLRAAIEGLAGKLDSRLLGYRLRNYRRRVSQGLFLARARTEHKTARWAAYPAAAFTDRSADEPQGTGCDGGNGGNRGDVVTTAEAALTDEYLMMETIL